LDILTSVDFQKDILNRVKATNPIVLPPLRDRREDIPLLVELFVRRCEESQRLNERSVEVRTIAEDAIDVLLNYTYPSGNVLELEGIVERAVSTWAGMRLLARQHLIFGNATPSLEAPTDNGTPPSAAPAARQYASVLFGSPGPAESGLARVAAVLEEAQPELFTDEELAGSLPLLQAGYARLVARCVKRALIVTRKRRAGSGRTRDQLQTAIQLLTNDPDLTGAGPKRMLKSLLNIMPEAVSVLIQDPVLSPYKHLVKTKRREKTQKRNLLDRKG
jgi:hypothetical protein